MTDDIIFSVMKAMADEDTATSAGPVETKLTAPAVQKRHIPRGSPTMRWTLPGFCGKAKVATSFGELPIEALRLRDPIKTISGSFMKVAWMDRIHLDEGFLSGFQDACPVRFQRGALGPNAPAEPTTMSPGQKVVIKREGEKPKVFSATKLTQRPNIDRMLTTNATYYMFHVGEPALVLVNGMWCAVAP